jgi:hypothetical protein
VHLIFKEHLMSAIQSGDKDWVRRYTAWQKAWPVPSFDANAFRRDDYGNLISWQAYGDRNSPWGWEVDRTAAERLGMLRALHWRLTERFRDMVPRPA